MCFLTNCPSKAQKDVSAAQSETIKFGLEQAKGTLPEARTALEDPLKFFKSLLTGDRNALSGVLGPDISTLTQNYETASRSTNEFAPRGGGATAANEESRFKEAGDIQNLFSSARLQGAQGEAGVAQMLAQLGLGEIGVSSSTAGNLAGSLQAQQDSSNAAKAQAGKSIGEIIALLAAGG